MRATDAAGLWAKNTIPQDTGFALSGLDASNLLASVVGSTNHINLRPGDTFYLIADVSSSPNNWGTLIGCGSGPRLNASAIGWTITQAASGYLALMGNGTTISDLGYVDSPRFGIVRICFRWQASDNHVWASVNGVTSSDCLGLTFACPPGAALDSSCRTTLGAVLPGDTLSAKSPGGLLAFAWIQGSEYVNASLESSTVILSGASRLRLPASVVSGATICWEASQDWDGAAATSTTRGSSPITLTKTGSPVRQDVSERQIILTDTRWRDRLISAAGSAAGGYTYRNAFARINAITSASRVCVETLEVGNSFPNPDFGVWKNGAFSSSLNAGQTNFRTCRDVNLGGGSSANVDIINGTQYGNESGPIPDGADSIQLLSLRVRVAEPSFVIQPDAVAPTNSVVFTTDSIGVGFGTTKPVSDAMAVLYRAAVAPTTSVALYGYGNATIYQETDGTYRTLTSFCDMIQSRMTGTTKNIWCNELGTNDLAFGKSKAAWKAIVLAACVELESRSIPGLHIYLLKVFQRISPAALTEGNANAGGADAADYRDACDEIAALNSSGRTAIGGTGVVSNSDMAADGLHIKTSGNATWTTYMLAAISL